MHYCVLYDAHLTRSRPKQLEKSRAFCLFCTWGDFFAQRRALERRRPCSRRYTLSSIHHCREERLVAPPSLPRGRSSAFPMGSKIKDCMSPLPPAFARIRLATFVQTQRWMRIPRSAAMTMGTITEQVSFYRMALVWLRDTGKAEQIGASAATS